MQSVCLFASSTPIQKHHMSKLKFDRRFKRSIANSACYTTAHFMWWCKKSKKSPKLICLQKMPQNYLILSFCSTESSDQESCVVWYQNSQSKIYFVKVCSPENWGKFRQRLTFPAFSLPQHYGERCQPKRQLVLFLPIAFLLVYLWRHQQLWENAGSVLADANTPKFICAHVS